MKYLEHLKSQIGKSETGDNQVEKQILCEIERVNYILLDASKSYNEGNHLKHDEERLDETYSFEYEYRNKCLDILDLINN